DGIAKVKPEQQVVVKPYQPKAAAPQGTQAPTADAKKAEDGKEPAEQKPAANAYGVLVHGSILYSSPHFCLGDFFGHYVSRYSYPNQYAYCPVSDHCSPHRNNCCNLSRRICRNC